MTTIDRIKRLIERFDLPRLPEQMNVITGGEGNYTWPNIIRPPLHEVLNRLDSAIGADTEWLSSLECDCLWHVGKTCSNRRAVGARLRLLEEILALSDLKRQFAV